MATTNAEQIVGLLNYAAISRQSTPSDKRRVSNAYPEALKKIIVAFSKGVKKGLYTEEEIKDFQETVSLVSVLDNRSEYLGIDSLTILCKELTSDVELENQDEMVRKIA